MMSDTSHLHITFFVQALENPAKSKEQGRPIYDDVELVRIRFAGDPKRELVAPAHQAYRYDRGAERRVTYAEDFARHYEAFKDGKQDLGEGTPISELPFLTESKRSELRALNVHTAEQLAALDGTPLQRIGMGGRALKEQAVAYIEVAKGSAKDTRFAAENAELREQIAAMQEQIAAMMAGIKVAVPDQDKFEGWPDDELRAFIKQKTGTAPRGQPSHDTLVRMAEEAEMTETEPAI